MLKMLSIGAVALVAASSVAYAGQFYLTEAQSQAAAVAACGLVEMKCEARVDAQVLQMELPPELIAEAPSEDEAFLMLATMSDQMCQTMYAEMGGAHYADGWRINFTIGGTVAISCPIDEY